MVDLNNSKWSNQNYTQMKKLTLLIAILIVCSAGYADHDPTIPNKDTVIIEFGENSKMVIITENKEDMAYLKDYDINQMINELISRVDSARADLQALIVTDKTGTQFLKDSVKKAESKPIESETTKLEYYGEDESSDTDLEYTRSYRYKHESNSNSYRDNSKEYKKYNSRTSSSFELQIGMCNWLEKDYSFPDETGADYSVKPWGSYMAAVGVNNKTQLLGPLIFNWGFDLSLYSWKMENPNMRIIKGEEITEFTEDMSVEGTKSKLGASYFSMSVVPMLDFSYGRSRKYGTFKKYGRDGFRIGAGGYVGYRMDSWTKFVYKDNGDVKKDKVSSNLYLNSFRYGVRGQVGFKGMDFFINYDMNTVFVEDKGPWLNAISFGIIL